MEFRVLLRWRNEQHSEHLAGNRTCLLCGFEALKGTWASYLLYYYFAGYSAQHDQVPCGGILGVSIIIAILYKFPAKTAMTTFCLGAYNDFNLSSIAYMYCAFLTGEKRFKKWQNRLSITNKLLWDPLTDMLCRQVWRQIFIFFL